MPQTCEYVTVCGKRDYRCVISGNLGGANVITKVFIRGGRRVRIREGDDAIGEIRVLSQRIQGKLLFSLCLVSFFPGCIYSGEEDCIHP